MVVQKGVFSGENNPAWKGGRIYDDDGYVLVWKPDHPFRNNDNYVREHRLVMEQYIGRYLTKVEEVHHKNGIKDDNRIENLQKCSKGEHTSIHMRKDLSKRLCSICDKKTYVDKKNHAHWYSDPNGGWFCDNCNRRYKNKIK